MASSSLITTGLLSVPSLHLNDQAKHVRFGAMPMNTLLTQNYKALARNSRRRSRPLNAMSKVSAGEETIVKESGATKSGNDIGILSIHHVGLLCENLERSLEFYQNLLGLEINEARPNDKLPYKGVWFWVGSEMIHLMELPNPDPLAGRPEHGGRDRHTCIAVRDVSKLKVVFDKAGIPYTLSKSGRPAIFARDPDANALEFTQVDN
ncbi:hypothetical protein MKW98_014521 [Papaver atlanticum]|uniref:VOC domain-containing protein n=1 Tax=Papaver atlanticum TaxID=357466 RepID=A0AAD4XEV3_9MAGN|nr:hypothetical protein MKW98_014521 [Papaver atlanticum]